MSPFRSWKSCVSQRTVPGVRQAWLGELCAAMIPALLALAIGSLGVGPLQAQGIARRNVNANANAALNGALIRLNRNPRDAEALIAAGNAALAMGDTDAAVGFFTRANSLSPDNPRIEAGLAGAKVRAEDPFSAIALFIAAEKGVAAGKGGAISPQLLGDRGLAYDLIGDNANAQQYYRQALAADGDTADANVEVSRRLALSLAIAGNRHASETVLSPLLQKQDRAAWRTRIFALAILGYEEEAVATAKSTMPPDLALQIAPYLRYMRRLTPAQQAAAANLGHFPQAAEIGQDDPRVAQYARTLDRSRLAGADPNADRTLVPAGTPLGTEVDKSAGQRRKDKHRASDRTALAASAIAAARPERGSTGNPAPPELLVSRETHPAGPSLLDSAGLPLNALSMPSPLAVPAVKSLPRPVSPPSPAPTIVQSLASGPPPQPFAISAPRSHVPQPAARPSFSDAFSAMSPVMADITPERGAVDVRRIRPARDIPKPPPPPSHPSRIWVELGVGRDTDRMAFDWRRMLKDDPEIFRGKRPFVSSWTRTNRLLVGPFETDKAANAFTDRLHKADRGSAFVWTSPAGQVVDPLDLQ